MKKYHILMIGFSCHHGHLKEFTHNLKKKNPSVEITLAITTDLNDKDNQFSYVDKLIIYKRKSSSKLGKVFKGLYYYFHFLLLRLKKNIDIVDIQYANSSIIRFIPLLKAITNNIVITPWGSDVLRVEGDKNVRELQNIYSEAKFVTTGKDTIVGKCLVSKFNVPSEKMVKLGWGGEFFDYIQENSENLTVDDAKERFNLKGRYVITCGYNTQKEQRHEEIVNAISEIRDKLPDNLTLLFPFTYGRTEGSDRYTDGIIKKCDELGLKCLTVTEHLNMSDLLKLRMATDIFVHVQTTDAGSRCVAEYVLCNKKLVHGAWIKYPYLEDNKPSCYFPVESMDQLGKCILRAYQTPIEELPEPVRNFLLERGWNKKMTLWNDFFESLL